MFVKYSLELPTPFSQLIDGNMRQYAKDKSWHLLYSYSQAPKWQSFNVLQTSAAVRIKHKALSFGQCIVLCTSVQCKPSNEPIFRSRAKYLFLKYSFSLQQGLKQNIGSCWFPTLGVSAMFPWQPHTKT